MLRSVGGWARWIAGIIGAIVIGVISNLAYASLSTSNLPYGNLAAAAIWPLAMVLVAIVTVAVVRSTPTTTATPTPDAAGSGDPVSPELLHARERLAELEAKERREQLDGMRQQLEGVSDNLRGLRSQLLEPGAPLHSSPNPVATASEMVENANIGLRIILQSEPDLLAEYEQPIDPAEIVGAEWNERTASVVTIKLTRIQRIRSKLMHAG